MTYVPGKWERCGNTLFYVKTFPHERVGYTHIDPADFVRVQWEERPEGFVIQRREIPETLDWASIEMVRFTLSLMDPRLQSRFWTWTSFMDNMKRRGLSPSQIVNAFSKVDPPEKNEILDVLDLAVFSAELSWRDQSSVVDTRSELDEALTDFGVMECL